MSLVLKEWIVYLAILTLTTALLLLLRPTHQITPKGIALPMTQEASQAIMHNPQWHGTAKPTHWINLEYHVTQDSPESEQTVIQSATALAKQAGSNSLMMQPIFFNQSTIAKGMLSILIGRGIGLTEAQAPSLPSSKISQ